MTKEQEQILIDAFEQTSPSAQQFLSEDTYTQIIQRLGEKYKLSEEESKEIQVKTLHYLLNIHSKREIVEDIINVLDQRTEQQIENILLEIEEKILNEKYKEEKHREISNWQKAIQK